jgi:hypothetical protein
MANRSLILFTIVSSLVHAAIMAVQAMGSVGQHGHLAGDVPALVLVAAVLGALVGGESSPATARPAPAA